MITIIDVCRAIGVEPEPHLTWAVGPRVRAIYEGRYGRLPTKDLRAKTSGQGSHCFAVYPDEMRGEIEVVIRSFRAEAARQLDLGL